MAEIADMMLSGVMCAQCGEWLECKECEEIGVPAYCSDDCAGDQDLDSDCYNICNH